MSFIIKILTHHDAGAYGISMPDVTHSEAYARFKMSYYGLDSKIAAIFDAVGRLDAMIPVNYSTSAVYIPHKDYSYPYLRDHGQFPWDQILHEVCAMLGIREIRAQLCCGAGRGLRETPFVAFPFDVRSDDRDEELLARFNKKTRNELRKALSAGFSIAVAGQEILPELCELYRENMRRHGTSPKSDGFFQKLFAAFGDRAAVIAVRDGKTLAGANLVICGDSDLRLLMNLSRVCYWPQCINNLLYWETIRYARDMGLRSADFGGGSLRDASHNHFKLGFGARMVPIYGLTFAPFLRRASAWLERKKRNMVMRMRRMFLR